MKGEEVQGENFEGLLLVQEFEGSVEKLWYSIVGTIRQFPPATSKLEDEDEELRQCLKEMKRRLGNMEALLVDSNESMRCENISAILYALLYIVKRITNKELILAPQLEVVGEESTGQVDHANKALEELICITERMLHQAVMGFSRNLVQCESALQYITGE
ncbi:hypothetical protein C1646_15429 [Rhizophagus diaphanus]|nr:hypothetical protein C1646_15429 [Rhizophagus diaphanus] [Rhizophagus sp. MUCL 43196]